MHHYCFIGFEINSCISSLDGSQKQSAAQSNTLHATREMHRVNILSINDLAAKLAEACDLNTALKSKQIQQDSESALAQAEITRLSQKLEKTYAKISSLEAKVVKLTSCYDDIYCELCNERHPCQHAVQYREVLKASHI